MRQLPLWLATFAVFALFVLPGLFGDGMYIDGLTYSAVARNLAAGDGTFWRLHYTDTLYPELYEQPPLVMGVQSLAYVVFGDHLLVDRFYTLATALLAAWLIVLIWRELWGHQPDIARHGWLPLFLWLTVPVNLWSYQSAMLENTMSVFLLAAVLVLLRLLPGRAGAGWALVAAGVFVFLGVLSKGMVALFPLGVPLAIWTSWRAPALQRTVAYTALVVAVPAVLMALVLQHPEARDSLSRYFESHVLAGAGGARDQAVGNRFGIVEDLLQEIAPPLAVAIVFLIVWRKLRPDGWGDGTDSRRRAGLFLMIGLMASLPIAISFKQSRYYLVPAFPYFAIGLASLIGPAVTQLVGRTDIGRTWRWWTAAMAGLCVVGIVWAALSLDRPSRDRQTLALTHALAAHVPSGSTLQICPSLWTEWGLHAYLARYLDVSLDRSAKERHYLLVTDDCRGAVELTGFDRLARLDDRHELYRRP